MKKWEVEAAPRLNSRDRPVHMARLCRELNKTLPATRSSSPTAASPDIGPACFTIPRRPAVSLSRTVASLPSAMGCQEASARAWLRPGGR